MAQLDLSKLKIQYADISTDSLIVSRAVTPFLGIVHQQYRLERNGEFFGKNNRPFYGETYTLSVKIAGSTIFQRGVLLPWENDADYKRVNRETYKPVYFKSTQRQWASKDWQSVDLDIGNNIFKVLSADSLLFELEDKVRDFGLPIDEAEGQKQGYLIWAYYAMEPEDSSTQVKLHPTAYQIDAKSDNTSMKVKPENTDNLLGGVFVIPVIGRNGNIQLYVGGVVSHKSQEEWTLSLLTRRSEDITREATDGKKEETE